jgi:hypothetical protein
MINENSGLQRIASKMTFFHIAQEIIDSRKKGAELFGTLMMMTPLTFDE